MTDEEKRRLHGICYRSKADGRLTEEEQRFIQRMFKMYPAEYREIQQAASQEAINDAKRGFGG